MIIVEKTVTADNADLLSGTDLANIPRDGQLDIYCASTQDDTLWSIRGPGNEPIITSQQVAKKTNAELDQEGDLPVSVGVTQGGAYKIAIDVTTAATVRARIIFRGDEEL